MSGLARKMAGDPRRRHVPRCPRPRTRSPGPAATRPGWLLHRLRCSRRTGARSTRGCARTSAQRRNGAAETSARLRPVTTPRHQTIRSAHGPPLAGSSSPRPPPEKLAPNGLPGVGGEDGWLASPPVVPGLPVAECEYVPYCLPPTRPHARVLIARAAHHEGKMNQFAAQVPAGQVSRVDGYGGPEGRVKA